MLSMLRLLTTLAIGLFCTQAAAQQAAWPKGPIRIVQPTETGTSVDRLIRGMQPFLAAELGVSIVVENRAGGMMTSGTRYVMDAPPDGNTIIAIPQPVWLGARRLMKSPPSDWASLGAVNYDIDGIMASNGKYKTLLEVLRDAKAGKPMTFGAVAGIGGYVGHRAMLRTLQLPSPKYVMYGSGGPLRIDVIGSHVDLSIATHDGWLPLHTAGQAAADQIPNLSTLRSLLVTRAVKEKYPQRYERLVAAVKKTAANPAFLEWAKKSNYAIAYVEADEDLRQMETLDKLAEQDPEAFGAR